MNVSNRTGVSLLKKMLYYQTRHISLSALNAMRIIDRPDDNSIHIPKYAKKHNENLDIAKSRLLYQSRKRGMLENDLLLSTFADKYLKNMNVQEIEQYDRLINEPSNDWDIYYWATGKKQVPTEFDNEMMNLLMEHAKNLKKEKRLRQPSLN